MLALIHQKYLLKYVYSLNNVAVNFLRIQHKQNNHKGSAIINLKLSFSPYIATENSVNVF